MLSRVAEQSAGRTAEAAPLAEAGNVAVRLDGVSRSFGEITALRKACLDIRRGELMTLLGPSGCGKTTLLNLVAGFLMPDTGEIVIDGERVNQLPTYRREIGMMFQSYALFPHMTVAANVGYGLRMRGVANAEIARRVADTLALVKLTGSEERRPRQLSGGQQQRVALARALVIRPKVLLLDEPFSALDRNLRASMQIEVKEIQRKLGVTAILVTHDQSEALSLSDRMAVMSEGGIRQVGTPDEIYRRPNDRFVAAFVGDASVIPARLDHVSEMTSTVVVGAARVCVPTRLLEGLAPNALVDLFVRPEQLAVADEAQPVAVEGIVVAQVYQGGHVDIHIDAAGAAPARLLIRLPGHQAMMRWSVGSRIGVAITTAEAVAFPRQAR